MIGSATLSRARISGFLGGRKHPPGRYQNRWAGRIASKIRCGVCGRRSL